MGRGPMGGRGGANPALNGFVIDVGVEIRDEESRLLDDDLVEIVDITLTNGEELRHLAKPWQPETRHLAHYLATLLRFILIPETFLSPGTFISFLANAFCCRIASAIVIIVPNTVKVTAIIS
jgi:hypothetical protein